MGDFLVNFPLFFRFDVLEHYYTTHSQNTSVDIKNMKMKKVSILYIYILSNYTIKIHAYFHTSFQACLLFTGRPHF